MIGRIYRPLYVAKLVAKPLKGLKNQRINTDFEKVSYSPLPGGKEMKKKYIKEIVRRLKLLDLEAVELVFRFVKNLKK